VAREAGPLEMADDGLEPLVGATAGVSGRWAVGGGRIRVSHAKSFRFFRFL
jgi:hypothetical protein